MRLQFLGTGSAFTTDPDNFQSNLILEADDGARLLIDCGSDARRALRAAGLGHDTITAVYISHLHGDHIGGLEWFGFTSYFNREGADRPRLFLPESLVTPLWENSLKAGMEVLDFGRGHLSDFFDVRPVPPDGSFIFGGATLTPVPLVHIRSADTVLYSHGLMIDAPNGSVLFTSDCLHQPEDLMPWVDRARLIFHDCDTDLKAGGAHAHYSQLRTLPAAVKARMWLYHYADGPLPDAPADGFAGFVRPRQTFDLGRALGADG